MFGTLDEDPHFSDEQLREWSWTAKQLEQNKESPTVRGDSKIDSDVAMGEQQEQRAADEVQLEGADASVRAAVLGKLDERDLQQRSTGAEEEKIEFGLKTD